MEAKIARIIEKVRKNERRLMRRQEQIEELKRQIKKLKERQCTYFEKYNKCVRIMRGEFQSPSNTPSTSNRTQ